MLKFVHDSNVIHLDIKPENIIRPKDKGPLVIVDFGASKLVTGRMNTANATANMGTSGYMAPEQSMGIQSFASDLYSLGVTCISLLTKKHPIELFDSGTNSWKWKRYLTRDVSDSLGKVLDKLLEPAVNERYGSASEVLEDIIGRTSNQKTRLGRRNLTIWEKAGIVATIVVALTAIIKIVKDSDSNQTAEPVKQVLPASRQDINYRKLREYLLQKDWEAADNETYEIMLKMAGQSAREKGYINHSDFESLSCTDLQTIDNLWRAASEGKLGFSAQQIIYESQGLNWQKMYNAVGWGSFADGTFTKTVDQELDFQTRRLRYKQGMEPNFQNPPPGHLPVTIGMVKGKVFPQFAEICKL